MSAMLVSRLLVAAALLVALPHSFTAAAAVSGDVRLNLIAPEEIFNSSTYDEAVETDDGSLVLEHPGRRNMRNYVENVDNEYNNKGVLKYSSSRRNGEDSVKSTDKQIDSLEDSREVNDGSFKHSGLNWGVPGGLESERAGSCYDNSGHSPRKGVLSPWKRWGKNDDGVPTVYYAFNNPGVSDQRIQEAMDYYEKHTCLRFEKIVGFHFGSHVSFSDGNSCSSLVGYQVLNLFWGQTLTLSRNCDTLVTVIHEIGHAIGLYHEQSRLGRHGYITVIYKNIKLRYISNFTPKLTLNYNTIYDYFSVMQYGPLSFSKNGGSTMVANKPEYDGLLVKERTGMSFMDLLQVNTMYGCSEYWLAKCQVMTSSCQNLGYFGPDCVCVCPDGTSGNNCETKTMEYTDALVKKYLPLNEKLTTAGTVETTKYPVPQLDEVIFTKEIKAPSCEKVVLTVVGFDLSYRSTLGLCVFEGVEIRLDDPITSGTWYCNKDLTSGQKMESKGDSLVIFYAKKKDTTNAHGGFSFAITFAPIPGCVV